MYSRGEANGEGFNALYTVLVKVLEVVEKTTAVGEVSLELVPVLSQILEAATVRKLSLELLVYEVRIRRRLGPASVSSSYSLSFDVGSDSLDSFEGSLGGHCGIFSDTCVCAIK